MELTKQIGVLRNRKTLDGRKADRNKVNLEYWNFNENLGDLLAPVVTSGCCTVWDWICTERRQSPAI